MLKPMTPTRDPHYRNTEAKPHVVEVSNLGMPGELLKRLRVFLVTGSSKIPVLPDMANRLLNLSNKPNVDISHLVREVERENTVTGRLLATANSTFYLRGTPAASVKAAILRLGLSETRDLVYRIVTASTVFKVSAYAAAVREIRNHSTVVAYLTRDLCRRGGFDHDLAFLCGLMHDVGKVVLLASAAASANPPPPLEELEDVIRADHPEAGALTGEYWKLPPPVVSAIRNHHSTGSSANDAYAVAVALSDRICRHLGFDGLPEPLDASDGPLLERARISGQALAEILEYAKQVREAVINEGA